MTQPVNVKAAKASTIKTIPVDVRGELLALSILRKQLHEIHAAAESYQNSIIEKLTGRKMDAALIRDLLAAHNRRSARTQRRAAMKHATAN